MPGSPIRRVSCKAKTEAADPVSGPFDTGWGMTDFDAPLSARQWGFITHQ
jgi:hypothetical protein